MISSGKYRQFFECRDSGNKLCPGNLALAPYKRLLPLPAYVNTGRQPSYPICSSISGISLASSPAKLNDVQPDGHKEEPSDETTNHFTETSHETAKLNKGPHTF